MVSQVILAVLCCFFGALGSIGLAAPNKIARYFGNGKITIDQRNELRAVYGGLPFGIAFICALSLISIEPMSARVGLFMCFVLLIAMAIGRVIGTCIERPTRRSYLFLFIELLLGGLAVYGYVVS